MNAFLAMSYCECLAIDATFSEPNVLASYNSLHRPLNITNNGVGGSKGAKTFQGTGYEWSQLIYRNQVFDTGIPCCAGDPVVPLSIMFNYKAPQISAGGRLTDT